MDGGKGRFFQDADVVEQALGVFGLKMHAVDVAQDDEVVKPRGAGRADAPLRAGAGEEGQRARVLAPAVDGVVFVVFKREPEEGEFGGVGLLGIERCADGLQFPRRAPVSRLLYSSRICLTPPM